MNHTGYKMCRSKMYKDISKQNRTRKSMYTVIEFYITCAVVPYYLTVDCDRFLKMHIVNSVCVCAMS